MTVRIRTEPEIRATWNTNRPNGRRWSCAHKSTETELNYTVRDGFSITAPFVTGGIQGLALRAAQARFPHLEILKQTPDPIPPDEYQP